MDDWDKAKPLEHFFPRLVALNAVKVALRKEFGERTRAVITKLKNAEPLVDDELSAHDIITDLVENGSTVAASVCWRPTSRVDSGYVNIMRFGTAKSLCVYWVQDVDRDNGYFDNIQDAIDDAYLNAWDAKELRVEF
jgi:hypothetical protein